MFRRVRTVGARRQRLGVVANRRLGAARLGHHADVTDAGERLHAGRRHETGGSSAADREERKAEDVRNLPERERILGGALVIFWGLGRMRTQERET